MKKLITITLILTTNLLANYAFSDEKTVKIDMHGGQSQTITNTHGFSKMKLHNGSGLQNISIKKPTNPVSPTVKEIQIKNNIKEGKK